jgi:APA family basic amino acid/polyamine antiporter
MEPPHAPSHHPALQRHFGLWHALALNVTMIVGAGVFITIPYMLRELPGPYALLGWLGAGALILVDGLIWSELATMFPGSGGTYLYLLEGFGRTRWGRLGAFLFIWQFLISGPLELASGLIAMDTFSQSLSPWFKEWNERWFLRVDLWKAQELAITLRPARMLCFLLGVAIIALLYRSIRGLGRLTLTFWLGVLLIMAWVGLEGLVRFDPSRAFDTTGARLPGGWELAQKLGTAMVLAMYSYLGYYNVCYIGDEVRDPGRTIPRAILGSAALVVVLFVGLHLAMLGTVSWQSVPTDEKQLENYSLAATFMQRTEGQWAESLVTVCLLWSCFGAAFAGMLGYSRIPYGAAREGNFFRVMGRVHPAHRIPHVSLFLVGGLTLFWSFFDLDKVIKALVITRILEQFLAQIAALVLLRRTQPERVRPFKVWLYPLPCALAAAGWLFLYVTADPLYITLGLLTLAAGVVAFLLWSARTGGWPFSKQGERSWR